MREVRLLRIEGSPTCEAEGKAGAALNAGSVRWGPVSRTHASSDLKTS